MTTNTVTVSEATMLSLIQQFVYVPDNQRITDTWDRDSEKSLLQKFARWMFLGALPKAPPALPLKYSTASRFPIPADEDSDFFHLHANRWASLIGQGYRFSEVQTAKTGEAGLRMTCSHCGTWLELVDDAERMTDLGSRYDFHKEILKACEAFAEHHTGTNAHSTQPRA